MGLAMGIVDAAVFVDKRVIPIDSKFSLENYNRILSRRWLRQSVSAMKRHLIDLKLRIDEAAKYQAGRKHDGFAFMFIPSEAVYFDLLINKVGAVADDTKSLVTWGTKRVIIVLLHIILAYLQRYCKATQSKDFRTGERNYQTRENLGNIWAHMRTIWKNWERIGAAVSSYNHAYKEFAKVDKDVLRITGGDQVGTANRIATD